MDQGSDFGPHTEFDGRVDISSLLNTSVALFGGSNFSGFSFVNVDMTWYSVRLGILQRMEHKFEQSNQGNKYNHGY